MPVIFHYLKPVSYTHLVIVVKGYCLSVEIRKACNLSPGIVSVFPDISKCEMCIRDSGHTVRMSYDSRGNLTQTVAAGKSRINFTYDIYNNLTSLSINGKTCLLYTSRCV